MDFNLMDTEDLEILLKITEIDIKLAEGINRSVKTVVYCIKGALAFVCFSFFFSGYVC